MVHRDVRSKNILITIKLANFKLSRYLNVDTLNHSQNLERVRYCAPELLEDPQTTNMIRDVKFIALESYFWKSLKREFHIKVMMIFWK